MRGLNAQTATARSIGGTTARHAIWPHGIAQDCRTVKVQVHRDAEITCANGEIPAKRRMSHSFGARARFGGPVHAHPDHGSCKGVDVLACDSAAKPPEGTPVVARQLDTALLVKTRCFWSTLSSRTTGNLIP